VPRRQVRWFWLPRISGSHHLDSPEALSAALERLPAPLRRFLQVRFLARHSLAETAAALGLSDQEAQQRQAEALSALRQELETTTRR
jgi:DNA-directed RNA polymerase specialized sigma24 family protein